MLVNKRVTFLLAIPWKPELLVSNNQAFRVVNSVELLVDTALTHALHPAIRILRVLKLHVNSWSPSPVLVGG